MNLFLALVLLGGVPSRLTQDVEKVTMEDAEGEEGQSLMKRWCYQYPNCGELKWGGLCARGQLQSPIDLPPTPTEPTCTIADFPHGAYTSKLFMMESNGRTVGIKLLDYKPNFYWKDVKALFTLHSIHFHWGPNDTLGSEHSINSTKFPLEMQMVHYNDKFPSIGDALLSGEKGALAIISVMFNISDKIKTSLILQPILRYLPGVHYPNAVVTVKEKLELKKFLRGDLVWTYRGSLTSPSCDEQVEWIVWREVLKLSPSDMQVFRGVRDTQGNPLLVNFRSTQPTNNRTVELCQVKFGKNKKTN